MPRHAARPCNPATIRGVGELGARSNSLIVGIPVRRCPHMHTPLTAGETKELSTMKMAYFPGFASKRTVELRPS
jgi:hypothetical protein